MGGNDNQPPQGRLGGLQQPECHGANRLRQPVNGSADAEADHGENPRDDLNEGSPVAFYGEGEVHETYIEHK